MEATGRPCSAAIARTRSFVSSPSGKRSRAIVCGARPGEHVGLVLGGVGGGAQQPVVGHARVVAGRERRGAEPRREVDHRVEPHAAVAAHARVRRQAGGVVVEPRLHDAGAERVAQVDREVRDAHAVRERARRAHGAGRAARALGVVLGVAPELERHGRDLEPSLSSAATALSTPPLIATSTRSAARRQRGLRHGRRAQRPCSASAARSAACSLPALRPPSSAATSALPTRAASSSGAPRDEIDARAGGRRQRAAARRVEARVDDRLALDAHVDPHEVAADRAAGAAGMAVRDRVAAADRMVQVLGEALVGHAPESGEVVLGRTGGAS